MNRVALLREAETACAGSLMLATPWLEAQTKRYPHLAVDAAALLAYKRRLHPTETHFTVNSTGFVRLFTPSTPPSSPTTRLPRSTSRFLDLDADHDPRVQIRTVRTGRRGPRHAFVVAGVAHRSYAAAIARLGGVA